MYPNCKGMRGGDQPFYTAVGYEKKAEVPMYQWETDIYASWDPKSAHRDYSKDICLFAHTMTRVCSKKDLIR